MIVAHPLSGRLHNLRSNPGGSGPAVLYNRVHLSYCTLCYTRLYTLGRQTAIYGRMPILSDANASTSRVKSASGLFGMDWLRL
jgi:hypothetical protein